MNIKLFATVFATVFLAELGDKTQLATLLYASDAAKSRLTIFAASAGALVLTSALGVIAGSTLARIIEPKLLSRIAGVGFLVIGAWTLVRTA